jgi:hypothetical protein
VQLLHHRPGRLDLCRSAEGCEKFAAVDPMRACAQIILAGQFARVDQPVDYIHGAEFGHQRAIEGDFVEPILDVARSLRRFITLDWIDLDDQNIRLD